MKKVILNATLTFGLLIGLTALVAYSAHQSREFNQDVQAVYDTDTTIYLDKTVTIDGLGWWQTDYTWIHIWDGTTDHYQQMSKVNDDLFSYVITSSIWSTFINDTVGVEFYVYDTTKLQNQTTFVGGQWLKESEHDYIRLTTANAEAKQELVTENKAVEEVKDDIEALTCGTPHAQIVGVVSLYEGLRAKGKQDIQNTEIPSTGTTYYERLYYFAIYTEAPPPSA